MVKNLDLNDENQGIAYYVPESDEINYRLAVSIIHKWDDIKILEYVESFDKSVEKQLQHITNIEYDVLIVH